MSTCWSRALVLLLVGCSAPPVEIGDELRLRRIAALRYDSGNFSLPDQPSNSWADDSAAADLGQALFVDAGLSGNGQIACTSCHVPERHFSDGRTTGLGLGELPRHTPTLVGAQRGPWFFWDGRRDSLWSQALGPLEEPLEMGGDRLAIAHHLSATRRPAYESVFGPLPDLEGLPAHGRPDPGAPSGTLHRGWLALTEVQQQAIDGVFANVGKALEAFERTLLPTETPFDAYARAVAAGDLAGGGHLGPVQVRGLELFAGEAGCVNCHNGPMFTDGAFHNLGLPPLAGVQVDLGRAVGVRRVMDTPFNCLGPHSDAAECPELVYVDPDFPDWMQAFKTPTLRNVARTAPYMHDGRFETLEEVLEFYEMLPGEPLVGHRELTLSPLELDQEDLAALLAFLSALTSPSPSG